MVEVQLGEDLVSQVELLYGKDIPVEASSTNLKIDSAGNLNLQYRNDDGKLLKNVAMTDDFAKRGLQESNMVDLRDEIEQRRKDIKRLNTISSAIFIGLGVLSLLAVGIIVVLTM